MSTLEEMPVSEIRRNNLLMQNTIDILDDEKETVLTELLRCSVCLELPEGKQVKVCEEGHHFCQTCHKDLKFCGVCRGKLLNTRNFVVEQIVSKLGIVFGISGQLPPIQPSSNLGPGKFKCLHECESKIFAYQMLPHLRKKHSTHLIDNVRSNPYSGRFSFTYKIPYKPNGKYVWSANVSDMGVFTAESIFSNSDFFGCVKFLGDKTSSGFSYQLVVKIPNKISDSSIEFSLTDCPVSSYLDDIYHIQNNSLGLKIKKEALLEYIKEETLITIFFSISKKIKKEEIDKPICLPERCLFFQNDRKTRRNINRNLRRKRLKEKLKNMADSEERVMEGISSLSL